MSLYKITSIKKTDSPAKNLNANETWYEFIIENNNNRITGFRSGSLKEVKTFIQTSVDRLNQKYSAVSSSKTFMKTVNETSIYNIGVNI